MAQYWLMRFLVKEVFDEMDKISLNDLFIKLDTLDYKMFQVHHTWKPEHSDFNGNNHMSLQKGMRNYHVNNNGWADIGQHITVFPDGIVVTGRDFNKDAVGISGHNKGAFMIEMIGNFDIGNDKLEGEQLKTVMLLTNYFIKRDIEIVFHRDHSYKSCPGSSIKKDTFLKVAKEMDNISDWALNSWWKLVDKQITDGSNPNEFLTREMESVFLDRLGLLD